MKLNRYAAGILIAAAFCGTATAGSMWTDLAGGAVDMARAATAKVPASPMVEVAFSPNQGALELVLKVIDSAQRDVRVLAYSFTSAPVTEALIRAKRRGVNVMVVVDHDHNVSRKTARGTDRARAALNAMTNAGIAVRTNGQYAIHHDKVVIADSSHVQTGSFNYSAAAAKSNSENVLVEWNNPKLAQIYLTHWTRNWSQGVAYLPEY